MTRTPTTASLEQLIATYCRAWSELDPASREAALEAVWAEGAIYSDPSVLAAGKSELIEHIAKVQAKYPGARVVRTSALDPHHSYLRFAWIAILADGTRLVEGVDFAELAHDGKLRRIVGFFGPLRDD